MKKKYLALFIVLVVAACQSSDKIVAPPPGPTVSMCHVTGSVGAIVDVPLTELALRRVGGDYVTDLQVDKLATDGDGIHFKRITDALGAARTVRTTRGEADAASCRITITVASGTLTGSTAQPTDPTAELFPLVIDVPGITLRGALNMHLDSDGRATTTGESAAATVITASPRLQLLGGSSSQTGVSEEIFVVTGHPDGTSGNGTVIEGFVFQNGHSANDSTFGGQGVLSMRVKDLVIRGNRFESGFTESVDLRASSAHVEKNHFSGGGVTCDVCLAGPGDFVVSDNRLLSGGIPGILVLPAVILPVPTPVEQFVAPATSLLTATIANNEVRDHIRKPVGVGIRVGAMGVGVPNVLGTSKVVITRNNLVGNNFGIIIEGAFPVAGSALRGDLNITTTGNTISGSCQADLLVSLSRHTTALGLSNQPYLKNSTFDLHFDEPALAWDKAWYSNPAGFGNMLVVNSEVMPNGAHAAYDAAKVCP